MKRFHETVSVGKEKHGKRVLQDVAQGVRFKSHDFNCQENIVKIKTIRDCEIRKIKRMYIAYERRSL